MIALSWLLWLFVIAIQAILHFCFIGRRTNPTTSSSSSSNGNRLNQSKHSQEEIKEQRDPSSSRGVQFQDHCNDCNEKQKHTIMIMRRNESIPSILKDDHGLKRRRIRSDVSLVSDENQMKPIIHSISSSTDGYDDDQYNDDDDDCHKEHDHTSQDCELDSFDEEEEWRLALIQRYVKEHPSQESIVSINMLNRSLDSTDDPHEKDSIITNRNGTTRITTSTTSSNSVPWVCT